jgi:hypothetical protein
MGCGLKRCLFVLAPPPPRLDTMTLRPTVTDIVSIRPTNVYILRQSDSTGVGLSDHPQTAQFDPLEVTLSVGCDNPTHVQSNPFSALPSGVGSVRTTTCRWYCYKRRCATRENFADAWVSWAQA